MDRSHFRWGFFILSLIIFLLPCTRHYISFNVYQAVVDIIRLCEHMFTARRTEVRIMNKFHCFLIFNPINLIFGCQLGFAVLVKIHCFSKGVTTFSTGHTHTESTPLVRSLVSAPSTKWPCWQRDWEQDEQARRGHVGV